MRIISYIIAIIVIFFGVTFAVLNSESISINYYFNQRMMPLSLLLVLVFTFGCLIGIAASLGLLLKAKLYNYRLQQRLTLAEKEIENLRAIPLQDKV